MIQALAHGLLIFSFIRQRSQRCSDHKHYILHMPVLSGLPGPVNAGSGVLYESRPSPGTCSLHLDLDCLGLGLRILDRVMAAKSCPSSVEFSPSRPSVNCANKSRSSGLGKIRTDPRQSKCRIAARRWNSTQPQLISSSRSCGSTTRHARLRSAQSSSSASLMRNSHGWEL